ncbi:MAG: OmpH family outer membrane protein [Gemmatimonadota bacterium]|nr:OmpH family outer membrane protein [Gemmatimonadota bacterium]
MRRTSFATLLLAFLVTTGVAEAQTLKIGYINSQQILATAPGAREAQAQFDRDVQAYQAEANQLQEEVTRMQQQLEQQQLTLSPEARANREQALRQKVQEASQRMSQLDELAARRRAELVQPVMDRISEAIESIRVEGNYALILDVAAGAIVAADAAPAGIPRRRRPVAAVRSGQG